MEILNIGPLELIIILLLMFVLLGPKEMLRTAYRVGQWVRNFVRSPMWKEIMGYSQEIRELPQKIMEESGLQETLAEVKESTQAAADELNAQIKEVTEAARIPEAEHVTLDSLGQTDTQTIKPDTISSSPETVPYQAEPAASTAPISDETTAAVESTVSEGNAVPSETAPSEEGALSSEGEASGEGEETAPATPPVGVQIGIPIAPWLTEKPVETESLVESVDPTGSPDPAGSLDAANAVVPTNLQPVEPSGEPPAVLAVAQGPVDSQPVADPVPAPRRQRTKSKPEENETPAPARTRRKKQAVEAEQPSVENAQPPAVLQADTSLETSVSAPRKGRPRKVVPPIESPAPNGVDVVHPGNGKAAHGEVEVTPARKPRARRSPKTDQTTDSAAEPASAEAEPASAEAQTDPEQVRPSDAA